MVKLNTIGKVVNVIKISWLMVGITILLLGLIEGSLSLGYLVRDRFRGSNPLKADYRVLADTYADQSWVENYYDEYGRVKSQWKPYVYWRRIPYRGEYINIDPDGIRLTTGTDPSPKEASTSPKIFMFGGSTLWGWGARDASTIPSLLAKELRSKGVVSEITNFGEAGYVSTQEVITLLLQLQKGNIPDLVVFYDGINDTFSAFQHHAAGLPQNELNRVKEFNLSQAEKFQERTRIVFQDLTRNLSTVRFLQRLFGRSVVLGETGSVATASRLNLAPHRGSLAQEVLDTYIGNIELVRALGEYYGFKYLFYWQPTLFQKVHLTNYEREQRDAVHFEQFFQKTYEVVRRSRLADKREYNFRDLSLVFADVREPIYVDWSHPGERGNELIVKRMVEDVLPTITSDKGGAKQKRAPSSDSGTPPRRR